jgi:hypothetical protein
MSKSLQPIVNSNTFGVWIERTNDIVTELATVVQFGGNSTDNANGSVYINGDIISTANVVVDVIKPFDTVLGANKVTIDSETVLNGNSLVDGVLTISNEGSGNTKLELADNETATWEIVTNNSNLFTIQTADSLTALTLNSTTNELTLTNLTIDADILPSSATFVDGITGPLTGDVKNEDGTVILQNGDDNTEATFNGTANNANYVSTLQDASGSNQFDSDDIDEGSTNQFFTTTRARGAFSEGTGVSISSGEISIGQAVGTLNDVTFNKVTTGTVEGSSSTLTLATNSVKLSPAGADRVTAGTTGGALYGAWDIYDISGGTGASLEVRGVIRSDSDITAFYNFSDIKLKENIDPIEGALDKVSALNGYTFNYKNKPDTRVAGVIAQELIQVLPEAVYDVVDNETDEASLAVRYDSVIPLLIEAIKDLKAEVEELKKSRS